MKTNLPWHLAMAMADGHLNIFQPYYVNYLKQARKIRGVHLSTCARDGDGWGSKRMSFGDYREHRAEATNTELHAAYSVAQLVERLISSYSLPISKYCLTYYVLYEFAFLTLSLLVLSAR